MKYKRSSPIIFKSVSETQKKEIIPWIIQNCSIFKFFDKSTISPLLEKVKMGISEEIQGRELFLRGEDDDINKYFYIIKRGNAFSWFALGEFDYRQNDNLAEKLMSNKVKRKGIIGEIFCEGDFIYPGLELFENPFLAITENTDYLQYFTPKKGYILSGVPFGDYVDPLILIKISVEEFDNLNFEKDIIARIAKMFLHHLYLKLILNRWKLWAQWTNDTELIILSILYFYFIGELPVQRWVTAEGEEIDARGVSYKLPKRLIKSFEIGITNLILFVGLHRKTILPYLSKDKGEYIFLRDKKLASLLECKYIKRKDLKFSSSSPAELLAYIESKVLSPSINKYQ